MSEAERLMAAALENQFTPYVGCDEAVRDKILKPLRRSGRTFMSEAEKIKLSKQIKRFEELRQRTYNDGKYAFQRVLDVTCAVYCVTEEDVISPKRFNRLVRARQQIIRIMKEQRGTSYSELGRRLGRDHSTVLHSYLSALDNPDVLKEAYDEIMEKLGAYSA